MAGNRARLRQADDSEKEHSCAMAAVSTIQERRNWRLRQGYLDWFDSCLYDWLIQSNKEQSEIGCLIDERHQIVCPDIEFRKVWIIELNLCKLT